MKIMVDLGNDNSLHRSRYLATAVKPILEALVEANLLYIQTHPVPPIYSSGVRYQEEPETGYESFDAIPVVMLRGNGDCDDLAPWRCAELRARGERATIRVQWRRSSNGQKLFHVVVRREDQSIEDPSRKLGMGGARSPMALAGPPRTRRQRLAQNGGNRDSRTISPRQLRALGLAHRGVHPNLGSPRPGSRSPGKAQVTTADRRRRI